MGAERANLSSLYKINPDQLVLRLRQLNNLQRELFFMETLIGGSGKTLPFYPKSSFASTLSQVMNPLTSKHHLSNSSPDKISTGAEVLDNTQSNYSASEKTFPAFPQQDIGILSRRFESKADPLMGVGTIGYDSNGGTSYGIYQLSSRQGSVDQFIKFLETKRPEWADRLKAAGKPNTGGKDGTFPQEWKAIATESPEEFARLQHEFIRERYFEPACSMIKSETGIDIHNEPRALQEMVWSMAVQHGVGGAVSIFKRALSDVAMGLEGEISREDVVERVYEIRAKKFTSSSPRVRQAVIRRFEEEKALVLAGLEIPKNSGLSQWS